MFAALTRRDSALRPPTDCPTVPRFPRTDLEGLPPEVVDHVDLEVLLVVESLGSGSDSFA